MVCMVTNLEVPFPEIIKYSLAVVMTANSNVPRVGLLSGILLNNDSFQL